MKSIIVIIFFPGKRRMFYVLTAKGVLLVVLFYFILFYFLLGVWTLIPIWRSNAVDKRNHSSRETIPGLGTTWRRQGVVLEASKCHGKVFFPVCASPQYI